MIKEENQLKKEARKISIKEGSAYSISDGFGIRNITPYALAIGANNFQIGLLSSVPSLLGNFSQLFGSKAVEKYPRKKIVFWAVILQALMWLLILIPGALYFLFNLKNTVPPMLLIAFYTLLTIFGAFGGPAWASWMRDIIPDKERGRYFGNRNRICGFISLVAMLAAGFILDYFKQTKIFIAFAILFFVSFIARYVSAGFFQRQYEPKFKPEEKKYFSFLQFIEKMRSNNFGRFVIFVSLISMTTAIASPFFAVYLLDELSLSSIQMGYLYYFTITLSASLSSILFMPLWGRFADKYGNLRVMKITGLFIPLVPFFWVLSIFLQGNLLPLVLFLFFIEALSGFFWAGFNLSAGNFIYDAVTRQRMALCVAYFNILNGIGTFIGASLGGFISSLNFTFSGLSPLLFVFILSGLLRLLVYLIMISKFHEVRDVKKFKVKPLVSLSFSKIHLLGFIQSRILNLRNT